MLNPSQSLHPSRYLKLAETQAKLGVSRTTFWRLRQLPDFPRGRQLRPGVIVYSEAELEQFMATLPKV